MGQPLGQPGDNPRNSHGRIQRGVSPGALPCFPGAPPPPSPFEVAELVELVIELV